jgi:hypothetical protein
MKNPNEEKAEQFALAAHRETLKGNPSYFHVIQGFEKAGDLYDRAGGVNAFKEAEKHYALALRYAEKINSTSDSKRIAGKLEELTGTRESIIKKRSPFAFFSIISLLTSLFFVSSGITGFAVLGLAENNLRNIGVCFFACGLILAFVYLKCKTKTKKKK